MHLSNLRPLLEELLKILQQAGPLAPLAVVPIYVVWSSCFLPGAVIFLAAGMLFGVAFGFPLVLFSSVLTASLLFMAGRRLHRGWIAEKAHHNPKIRVLDDMVSERGWKMVFLLRLACLLPFPMMNYALGMSRVSFRAYLGASILGMAPGILLYVYLGASVGEAILQPGHPVEPLEKILAAVGAAAMIGVGIYAARIVKKALKQAPSGRVQ